MKHSAAFGIVGILVVLLLLLGPLSGGTVGVFQGTVIAPEERLARPGWVFVQARNGSARHVDVSKAKIVVSESVPKNQRKLAAKDLRPDTEVLVTAEQGPDGEWRATQVEVLHLGRSSRR